MIKRKKLKCMRCFKFDIPKEMHIVNETSSMCFDCCEILGINIGNKSKSNFFGTAFSKDLKETRLRSENPIHALDNLSKTEVRQPRKQSKQLDSVRQIIPS